VSMSRRDFLGAAAQTATALPVSWREPPPALARERASSEAVDLTFASARQAITAIRSSRISAVELTELAYKRIDAVNPSINAVVVQMREEAFARAREADSQRARGKNLGPLHGVPVTIKDGYEIKGVRTTAGNPAWKNYIPTRDSAVVGRLREAGAILLGITNVPPMLSDWQSYNKIYGQTSNPWDRTRTPGGSTGGGAAALAAGIGFLATGSDVAGSIRVPAHFCGVYGHKPTLNVVSCRGLIPPPPGVIREAGFVNVCGALARDAEDLALALSVLGGPDGDNEIAYRWELPPPRKQHLKDYRIGYVLDDKLCPVASDEHRVLTEAITALHKAGVRLTEGWPAGVDQRKDFQSYFFLVQASIDEGPDGALLKDLLAARRRQLVARALWQDYFHAFDAFLMPVTFLSAFKHDHREPSSARILTTPEGPRQYKDLMFWPSFASYTGHPATVAPIGLTNRGLPVGLQIVGPYLEDATPIDIAAKMREVVGGFRIPRDI